MIQLAALFLIAIIGYALGRIRIGGLQLGTSAILLVALVAGHFGLEVPALMRDLGLAAFITSVGLLAGPSFFSHLRHRAWAYIVLVFIIIGTGFICCLLAMNLLHIPSPLAAGMMAGALTSSPGLAAVLEASGDSAAAVGYGVAYPLGVVEVVLFVQWIPKLRHTRWNSGKAAAGIKPDERRPLRLEPLGLVNFCVVALLGLLLGMLKVPLPGGMEFSLGASGGPLLVGLLAGHWGQNSRRDIVTPPETLKVVQECGLALFFIAAGVGAGAGFIDIVRQYGLLLFLSGAVMTFIPMLAGYLSARRLLKLELRDNLGALCGGMTSSPALGALVNMAGSEAAASYAVTYPLALILMTLAIQAIMLL